MSPLSSDPPDVKNYKAKRRADALLYGTIITALGSIVLSALTTAKTADQTPKEVSKTAFDARDEQLEKIKTELRRLDNNDQLIVSYVKGMQATMPQFAVNTAAPRKPVVIVTPPIAPVTPPKPPELSKTPDLPKLESFDALGR